MVPLAPRLVFGIQLLSTLSMFGIIWFVQIVHYPLFVEIVPSSFTRYETAYANRMGFIAGPLMVAELGSALMLLAPSFRLPGIPAWEAWCGLGLVGLLWASTALIQVPLHNQLHTAYNLNVIQRLVLSNWIRTVAWTARAALVLVWADRLARIGS